MKTNRITSSARGAQKGGTKPVRRAPAQRSAGTRFFEGILQASSEGILAVGRENEVIFANERFVEMWRIPQELMNQKDDALLLRYVPDQLSDPQGFLRKVQELYRSAEESFDTLRFKDGRVFERLSRPLLRGGKLQGRVWSFRDVTERQRIVNALAASEAELRALFASMQDVALVIDREGVYRKIAPTNPSLLVRPPEELLGKNLADIFPADHAREFRGVVRRVLDTSQTARIEYELKIGGQPVWFQATVTPLDADNTLWVAHDITRRKQMEEALRTAEANYRSIFEYATVGIYQSTPQGKFLRVNPMLARIFDYDSPEDFINSVENLETDYYVNPADRREFQRLLLEQGEAHGMTSRNKRKDGALIWTQESARAVKDASGAILYYEGFVTDITLRRQAEEELRRAKEAIETANLELGQSLEREKLLACTDGLTGLYNHRHFFELAAREFQAALRHGRPLTFLMFDMDRFKTINDTLGHAAGDRLLAQVAQVVVAQVRASDVTARYGGDEFIVMLPHADAQQALPVAERIRAAVAGIRLQSDKPLTAITLSMGVAELRRDPPEESVGRVIQRADEALYAAKEGGRNRTVISGGR